MTRERPASNRRQQKADISGTPVRTISEYLAEVERLVDRWTPRGVDWYVSPWFRGQANAGWELEPGWYRLPGPGRKRGDAWYNEHNLVSEFKLRAPLYLQAQPSSDWQWLFVMQHYGLPTRLLDWTESALLGLYFAVREPCPGADAGVWVLNPWWLNNRSLGRREIPLAGDSVLAPWAPLSERGHVKGLLPVAIRPVHGTSRIAAQKGLFTVHGRQRRALTTLATVRVDNGPGIQLLRVPAEGIPLVRRGLAVAGVTESSVFRELDGLCREIKREFFDI